MPATSTADRRSPTGPGSASRQSRKTGRSSPAWTIGTTIAAGTCGWRTAGPVRHLIHKWPQDALKVVANAALKAGQWNHVLVTYDGSRQAGGVKIYVNGKLQPTSVQANGLKGTIRTTVPLKMAQRHGGGRLEDVRVEDLRIYDRLLRPARSSNWPARAGLRPCWPSRRTSGPRPRTTSCMPGGSGGRSAIPGADGPDRGLDAGTSGPPGPRHRGPRDAGARRAAHGLRALPRRLRQAARAGVAAARRRSCRPCRPTCRGTGSGFAQWLLRPEHPLTARVTVNRFWQEMFGTGLVRTTEDFGVNGETPSHPELLDWLAVEFRESGWDVKQLFRLMVTSATYRQAAPCHAREAGKGPAEPAAVARPALPHGRRDDPRLCPGGQRPAGGEDRRAERAGRISPTASGRRWPCRRATRAIIAPTAARTCIGAACTRSGSGPPRRPRWTFFNAPSREYAPCAASGPTRRLQALVTLNDPQFVEAARHLAQRR